MSTFGDTSRDEIRETLIAKIRKAYPGRLPESIEREIELGNIQSLRKQLAWAEAISTTEQTEPREYSGPSPRIQGKERELRARVLSTKTGAGRPMHTYVLARDESEGFYDGPDWVPFNLWGLYKYEGQHPSINQCAEKLIKDLRAKHLWAAIALKYDRPDLVAANLPIICANAHADWRVQPRDKPSEYKKRREAIGKKCKQIAAELNRFYLHRDEDCHETPGMYDFTELMTDAERERFHRMVRIMAFKIHNDARRGAGARMLDWDEYTDDDDGNRYSLADRDAPAIYNLMLRDHTASHAEVHYGGVPTLPDMLRRIGDKFIADGDDPPLSRPNSRNLERNRFAQAIIKYFWVSFGDPSPAIIADIVSIFFEQGIEPNEVSQMIPKIKDDNPPPVP